jgi:NADH:ubiquinone oxidoreductase subunit 6 (subunit J)
MAVAVVDVAIAAGAVVVMAAVVATATDLASPEINSGGRKAVAIFLPSNHCHTIHETVGTGRLS